MRFDLHKRANASLHSGIDLKQVVRLPHDEEINDWIAVHGTPLPRIRTELLSHKIYLTLASSRLRENQFLVVNLVVNLGEFFKTGCHRQD